MKMNFDNETHVNTPNNNIFIETKKNQILHNIIMQFKYICFK